MEYFIVGRTIVNDIKFYDGSIIKQVLGGAVYCVSGLLPWTNNILYVSGVGSDFDLWYGEYFKLNNLSKEGLKYRIPKTNYNIVVYKEDGQWNEHSIYSKTYFEDHFVDIEISVNDFIDDVTDNTKGLYTESSVIESFWNDIDVLRNKYPSLKIMWEIPTIDSMTKDRHYKVIENINNCDMFSINLPEAKTLFNVEDERECIIELQKLNKPVFFRVGINGAYLINNDEIIYLDSVKSKDTVDPTGCGNLSTATAMYGLCEGLSNEKVISMANVSACYNTIQYGPKITYTETDKEEINKLVRENIKLVEKIEI